jgi:HPt (histidine-containing phosphotransfer) domain-containing protein
MAYHEFENLYSNKSILKEAMNITLTYMPGQILELEEALREKNAGRVSAAAHIIKGSAGSMYLRIMARIAGKIETDSKGNWNDNLELQLSELKAEWEIVEKIILEKINSLNMN